MLKYSLFHTWVLQDQDSLHFKVGLSRHIVSTLGQINYIGLPNVGDSVLKGSSLVILETSKSAIEAYAPLSGEIIQVNNLLDASTEFINKDPEGLGWLCIIAATEKALREAELLTSEQYHALS